MKAKLKDIAELSSGKLLTRVSTKYDGPKTTRKVLYHKGDEIYTEEKEVAADIDEKSLTHRGDIVFRLSYPQRAVRVDNDNIGEDVLITSKFAVIRVRDETVNPDYLTYLLNSELIFKELSKYNEGIIKQVKNKDLAELELIFPSRETQDEIVDYLDLVSKEIRLEKQLIEENENLKESILQKFSLGNGV